MKIIKKSIALLLCASFLFSLSGCSFFWLRGTPEKKTETADAPAASDAAGTDGRTDFNENTTDATPAAAQADSRVEEILARMTTADKVAQMFIVTPDTLTNYEGSVTETGEAAKAAFDTCPVAGIIYLEESLQSAEQVKRMLSAMQEISVSRTGLPAFICVDEEGGEVARISGSGRFDGVGSYQTMSSLGEEGDADKAYAIGAEIGGYLTDFGFNVDFAPVADVLTNDNNTVVRYRSFGSDPQLVANMARSFSMGLMSRGVLATYKHFPGHGATSEDSHKGFAISNQTREELNAVDLVPFADAVANHIPFIMAGHITLPNVTEDDRPASLSKTVLTGILREEMGYDGIIITDAMNMGAITDNYAVADAAVLAVEAGNDILLLASDLDAYYHALLDAVESGRIPMERIDESVRRIIRTKLQYLQPVG